MTLDTLTDKILKRIDEPHSELLGVDKRNNPFSITTGGHDLMLQFDIKELITSYTEERVQDAIREYRS